MVYLTKNAEDVLALWIRKDYERDQAEKLLVKLQEAEGSRKDGEGWLDSMN